MLRTFHNSLAKLTTPSLHCNVRALSALDINKLDEVMRLPDPIQQLYGTKREQFPLLFS